MTVTRGPRPRRLGAAAPNAPPCRRHHDGWPRELANDTAEFGEGNAKGMAARGARAGVHAMCPALRPVVYCNYTYHAAAMVPE